MTLQQACFDYNVINIDWLHLMMNEIHSTKHHQSRKCIWFCLKEKMFQTNWNCDSWVYYLSWQRYVIDQEVKIWIEPRLRTYLISSKKIHWNSSDTHPTKSWTWIIRAVPSRMSRRQNRLNLWNMSSQKKSRSEYVLLKSRCTLS